MDTATISSHFNYPGTPGCGLPRTTACVKYHIVKTLMLMQNTKVWEEWGGEKRQPSKRSLTQQHKFGGRDDCKHWTVKLRLPLGRESINAAVVFWGYFICHTKWQFECLSMTTSPITTSSPLFLPLQASSSQFNVCSHRLKIHTVSDSVLNRKEPSC